MKTKLSNQNFIAGFLLLLSMVRVLKEALRLDMGSGRIFLFVIITWSALHFLFSKKRLLVGSGLLLGAGLTLAVLYPALHRWLDFIKYKNPLQLGLSKVLASLFRMDTWPEFIFYISDALLQGADIGGQVLSFNVVSVFLFAFILGLILYVNMLKQRHYGYYLLPLAVFVQQWFQYAESIQSNFSIYFIGFIMLAGTYTKEKTHVASLGASYGVKHFAAKRYGTYLFILGTLVIMISNVVLFFTPVDGINIAVGELVPNILDMRTGYKRQSMAMFTFKQTMYHPYEERLGGPVVRGENPVLLRVWSDKAGAYLRGRVKTKYTGSSWVSEHVLFQNNNDYSKWTGVPNTRQSSYELTIVPEGISTKTLFAPLGVKTTSLDKSKVFLNPDGAMYYKRESLEGALDVYSIRGVDYSMRIEDESIYLDLPDGFDARVIEKARSITEGLESDYEKMEALKDWLRKSYPYNLEPGLPPADDDFVAYFLFEEKSGYCTYFASALATMGRTLDIPTRYVEGFIMPFSREPDGSYPVRADRAHAWTEAYIEGEGWRIFEATPAYNGSSANLDDQDRQSLPDLSGAVANDESQFTLESKEDLLDVAISEDAGYTPVASPDYSDEILYGLVLLFGLVLVGAFYQYQKVKRHFERGSYRQLAIRQIYYLEDLLDIESDILTPAEKLRDFIISKDDFEKNTEFAYDIIDKVNAVLYGGIDVNEDTFDQIKALVVHIERETKGRLNRIKYVHDLKT